MRGASLTLNQTAIHDLYLPELSVEGYAEKEIDDLSRRMGGSILDCHFEIKD